MLNKLKTFRPLSSWRTLIIGITAVLIFIIVLFIISLLGSPRNRQFISWWQGSAPTREALTTTQQEACTDAPFILPADGYIGLLYGDPRGPYSTSRPHQGIDIFSSEGPGAIPVYAAYDGYVTRESTWRSTLIMRLPEDPLQPERQIWLYYTHMARHGGEDDYIEPDFPPGTYEKFVTQGTLLGYTGNYNGTALNPVGVHLHFSIVLDNGEGGYLNELEFSNTLDPSPYLGMALNYDCAPPGPPVCTVEVSCSVNN